MKKNTIKFSWRISLLFLFCIGLYTSCSKDDASNDENCTVGAIVDCDKMVFLDWIEAFENQNLPLDAFEDQDSFINFKFANSPSFRVCKQLFQNYIIDDANCISKWVLNGIDTIFVPMLCQVDFNIEHNPSGYNPLGALLSFEAPRDCRVKLTLFAKAPATENLVHEFGVLATNHDIPLLGMYSDYLNSYQIELSDDSGVVFYSDTLHVETPELDIDPPIQILKLDRSKMAKGDFHLVSSLTYANPSIVYMFDDYGEIRWILDFKTHPVLKILYFDVGLELLRNGNLYFGDKRSNTIYEVDFLGNIINTWNLPAGYGFHHQVYEKQDGNFLITANYDQSTHLNGKQTIEDYILELDRSTGAIVHQWDLKMFLDEERTAYANYPSDDPVDWAHANSVEYDASDNSIIVSVRNQAVIKIGYDDELKWIMAPHKGWGNNRLGQDCNQFLLQPIDPNGNIYDEDIRLGISQSASFDWNWAQHAVSILPNGNIIMFDNGSTRNYGQAESYSRAVEYEIDPSNMTVKQIWQYGKERGEECYARIISDVDYFPANNNVLFAPGIDVYNGVSNLGGRIVELDYTTQEVYFEALIFTGGLCFHRVERMDLYQ